MTLNIVSDMVQQDTLNIRIRVRIKVQTTSVGFALLASDTISHCESRVRGGSCHRRWPAPTSTEFVAFRLPDVSVQNIVTNAELCHSPPRRPFRRGRSASRCGTRVKGMDLFKFTTLTRRFSNSSTCNS